MDLQQAADRLRALHTAAEPLVLPNAWDAASARAVVEAGFPAIATSSVAVAHALGYEDGEQTPPDEMFAAVARIARAVEVPVTADIEGGYGLPPHEVGERLLAAGAVGCNLEDTDHTTHALRDPNQQVDRLARSRRLPERAASTSSSTPAPMSSFVPLPTRRRPSTRLFAAAACTSSRVPNASFPSAPATRPPFAPWSTAFPVRSTSSPACATRRAGGDCTSWACAASAMRADCIAPCLWIIRGD